MTIKDRYWSGYLDYRHGATKPVSLPKIPSLAPPKIFKGQVRAAMVDMIGHHLDDWRRSAFEREGEAVAFIRSSLCAVGHPFQQSEAEAFGLVGAALKRNGARRPSYEEGQPNFTAGHECCAKCRGYLPNDGRIGLRNYTFCSIACARAYYKYEDDERPLAENRIRMKAYRMLKAEEYPPRQCGHCQETFHPKFDASSQIYCSTVCRARARRTVEDRPCAFCKTTFRPSRGAKDQKFCNFSCKQKGMAPPPKKIYERSCGWCEAAFSTTRSFQLFCKEAHRAAAKRAEKRARRLETKARLELAVESNVIYLTPEIFDRMFYRRKAVSKTSNISAKEALDRLFA